MKTRVFFLSVLVLWSFAAVLNAGDIPSVVSTEWLRTNVSDPRLVLLDVRKVEAYREGHIPGAINLFFGAWTSRERGLDCELPQQDELSDILRSTGIEKDSRIVLVGSADSEWGMVCTTRTAWTLKFAGLENVAILDGGYQKWLKEGGPISAHRHSPKPGSYAGQWKECCRADKEYVRQHLGRATILDTRSPSLFAGKPDPTFLRRPGHIPGAVNLPFDLVFTADRRFKTPNELAAIAYPVIGNDRMKDIIILCCNGRFASTWWFVLSEILLFKNVRVYDGSMEEWCKDLALPVVTDK